MQLQYIKISELKTTAINVRKKGRKDVADLVPSIRSLGLLQPLLVRPNCSGFEIVAGQRRYHALCKIAAETGANDESGATIDPVPCIVMDDGDDAKAIEASLAENIARLPMDEIDQYKAFAALLKKGQSVEDIAAQFGITERLVKQRLAIANLTTPILTAYSKDEIDPQTLRLLTMASKKQQKAWFALFNDADEYAPEGYRLKSWLFGGAQILTDAVLFDLEEYTGGIVSDLFGEERYFDDPKAFWTLQNAAIAKAKETYLAEGWEDVIILDVGAYFPSYEYVDTPKDNGGKVYVTCANNGEVTFYEGQLPRKEAKARLKAAKGENPLPAAKPELTQPMQRYLELHRHSAVRAALLKDGQDGGGIALRLAVAQIIAGSDLWCVHAEPRKTGTEAIAASLASNKAEASFIEERAHICELLAIENEGENTQSGDDKAGTDPTIIPRKADWRTSRDLHAIFARLLSLSDNEVSRILTYLVAESLPCGSAMVESLADMLDIDMTASWTPDQAFLDLMRDKEAINAMLAEVAGKAPADAHIGSTAKLQKKIIADCLSGERKPAIKGWSPRYMAVPMQAYTQLGGIAAMTGYSAIHDYYATDDGDNVKADMTARKAA